jgi:septum formation protein
VPDNAILVLASGSPRRRQLLGLGNWAFTVIVSDVDESQQAGESPKDYVLRLAKEKALAVAGQTDPDRMVIAADTAVIDGTEILGKPKNKEDAERMLRQLCGRTHQVYTGLAILRVRDGRMITELCVTDVPMRSYSNKEVSDYVQTGDPMDKAGAYAIQHLRFQPVESMHGCYASVMGLPMCHVLRALQKFDVHPDVNVPDACQSLLNYECPVSRSILKGETAG